LLMGWVTSRLNARLKGYVYREYGPLDRGIILLQLCR